MKALITAIFLATSIHVSATPADSSVAVQNDCGVESSFAQKVSSFRDRGATREQEIHRFLSYPVAQAPFDLARQKAELADINFVFDNPALGPNDIQQSVFFSCKKKSLDPSYYAGKDEATFH